MDMFLSVWLFSGWAYLSSVMAKPFSGPTTQLDIGYISQFVNVRYNVVDNFYSADRFLARITLKNSGSSTIRPGSWCIYFNFMFVIIPNMNATDTLKVTKLNAMFHSLTLGASVTTWLPGQETSLSFVAHLWSVARTDSLPNWYVTAPGLEHRLLRSTAGESLAFVENFGEEQKWKRYSFDLHTPPTPLERYKLHYIVHAVDARESKWRILPTPYKAKIGERPTIDLSSRNWIIYIPDKYSELLPAAELLREKTNLQITHIAAARHYVEFIVSLPEIPTSFRHTADEAYQLKVDQTSQKVTIKAGSVQGAFNAVQSLLSLVDRTLLLPECDITDVPRFSFRGLHVDIARNFRRVNELISIIDVMATYKLNKLHLHLTDDEAWRIEIPDLPELTEIGSQRCHDLTETKCLLPFLGSTPTPSYPGSGFLTTQEYQTILRYAKSRGVEVIPEIDVPGHSHAAIQAMRARSNKNQSDRSNTKGSDYILWDPDDRSEYVTNQHFTDDAINPCIESTYKFMETVITTLIRLHEPIQPLKTFHLGGDEVGREAWSKSPKCAEFRDKNTQYKTSKELKAYFVKRVSEILLKHGLSISAWEDGLYADQLFEKETLSLGEVRVNSWNNVWEWGGGGRAYEMANAGYKVIMSQATHLYFDHPYSPDPEERGLYWATRSINTRKVFSFMPLRLYTHIDTLISGEVIESPDSVCGKNMAECPKLTHNENIIGMQASLWSELLRTLDQVSAAAYPRVIALAERAWHEAPWETMVDNEERKSAESRDWGQFAATVGHKEFLRLDARNVKYHLSPPGAKVEEGRLFTNTPFPGLSVEYSEDQGKTWHSANNRPVLTNNNVKILRSKSADGRRSSALVVLHIQGSYPDVPPTLQRTSLMSIIFLSFTLCLGFAVIRFIIAKRRILWSRLIRFIMSIVNKKVR